MTLCTVAEVLAETNYPSGDLGGKITQAIIHAELQIKAELSKYGISIPASSDVLKPASLNLSKVEIIRSRWIDGSASKGATGIGNITDTQIEALKQEAQKAIEAYIRETGTYDQYRYYIKKVN